MTAMGHSRRIKREADMSGIPHRITLAAERN